MISKPYCLSQMANQKLRCLLRGYNRVSPYGDRVPILSLIERIVGPTVTWGPLVNFVGHFRLRP